MSLSIILSFVSVDYLWIIIGAAFIILGIIGCFHSTVPGPPLSYMGLLMLQLLSTEHFSTLKMIILAVIAFIAMFLDFIVPVIKNKKIGIYKASMIIRLLTSLYFAFEFTRAIIKYA